MKTVYLFSFSIILVLVTLLKLEKNLFVFTLFIAFLVFVVKRFHYKLALLFLFLSIIYYLLPFIKIPVFGINLNFSYLSSRVKPYVDLFLLNDKNNLLYQYSLKLGITYLIAISGLHFNLIYNFLVKIVNHFFDEIISNLIIFSFLFFYLIVLNFSISALRAFLMLLLSFLNKNYWKKYFNSLDIFFISLGMITILFPKSILTYSYIYSFTLTFFLLVIKDYTKLSFFKLSLFSYLVSIPISCTLNGYINIFTPFYSYILTTPYLIAIGFCFVLLVFPFLESVLYYYFYALEKLSGFLGKTSFYFSLSFDKFLVILYYILLFLFILSLESKIRKNICQKGLSFLIVIAILMLKPYIENPYQVTFLNVYQGDCILFSSRYSSVGYMVDCGGNYNVDIAGKLIYPFLEKKGIKKIKVFVKSHNDYDHIGALENLKKLIEIEQIKEDVSNVCFFSFCFENINKNSYGNDNDNSVVLYGKYSSINLLLTGDISSIVEEDILENYPFLKVDVLKVAHHGSKTSSSFDFVNHYKPKVSIISYGLNNYGHPHNEVINRLKIVGSQIYTTFENGNITIEYSLKSMKISFSKRKKVHFIAL